MLGKGLEKQGKGAESKVKKGNFPLNVSSGPANALVCATGYSIPTVLSKLSHV